MYTVHRTAIYQCAKLHTAETAKSLAVLCKILFKSTLRIQDKDSLKKYLEDTKVRQYLQDTF